MSPNQVKSLLNSHFSEITLAGDQVYRATKKHDQGIYQICYVDFSQKVLDPDFDIDGYQRSLLMEDYYSNEGAIQWNFYLYFLIDEERLDNSILPMIKYKIEENRKLTRKFVLTASEFKETTKTIITNDSVEKPLDIIEHWKKNINDQLHGLFNTKNAMNGIVESFIAGKDIKKNAPIRKRLSVEKFSAIKRLKLNKYRAFPLKRSFDFGKINLIHGPNAVGKTSLLEAIELSVCGKTIRNPDHSETFDFTITSIDDESTQIRKFQDIEYRSRDFHWYGRNYRQGNFLYRSFARFNFFDADAAVYFSERIDKEGGIDEALSSIVFGSEADEIFKRFVATEALFNTEKSNLDFYLNRDNSELNRLKKEFLEKSKADVEIHTQDFIKLRLRELGFRQNEFDVEALENILNDLGEAGVAITGWDSLNEKFEIFTFGEFDNSLIKLKEIRDQLIKLDREKDVNISKDREYKTELLRLEKRVRNFESLRNYERSGAKNLEQLEKSFTQYKAKIEVFDKVNRLFAQLDHKVLKEYENISVAEALNLSILELNSIISKEASNNVRLKNIKDKLNHVTVLIKQIKTLGKNITHEIPDVEICPLCETNLKPSNLAQKLEGELEALSNNDELDTLLENNSQLSKLRLQFEHKSASLNLLVEIQALLNDELNNNILIKQFLSNLETASKELSITKSQCELVKQKLEKFAEENFTTKELKIIYDELSFTPRPHDQLLEIDACISECNSKINELSLLQSDLSNESKRIADELHHIKNITKPFDESLNSLIVDNFISKINDVKDSIIKLKSSISVVDDDSPTSIEFRIHEGKKLIGSYLNSISTKNSLHALGVKIEMLDNLIANYKAKRQRAVEAIGVLNSIITKHKPSILLNEFMQKYARMISVTFEQIHSPREFEEIVFKNRALFAVKTSDKSHVPLTMLSTGQRTAFVLAVFLAMNTSVEDAPRLLIFDDPVAYVDDLNVLSFIDYLQKMALDGDRQIFFATANKRIASLFEKKFDFLRNSDNGFKSILLSRLEYDQIIEYAS